MFKLSQKILLLIRHGPVDRSAGSMDEKQGLDPRGIELAYETSSALSEQLDVEEIKHVKLWCSEYRHAREHAGTVKKALEDRSISVVASTKENLNPSVFRRWSRENVTEFARDIKSMLKIINEDGALVIVGHQPQLGWLCEQFHGAIAIARSEIVCLCFSTTHVWNSLKWTRSHLLWSIGPTDKETFEQLRDKIKSKMETAKLLGTFIIFFLGVVLGILSDEKKLQFLTDSCAHTRALLGGLSGIAIAERNEIYLVTIAISVICLFLAVAFYLISMYAYDRLLMPTRFWAEGIKTGSPRWLPQRPPSSSLLVLQVNMMRIWRLLFTPATGFVVASLIGFALVVMRADPLEYILGIMVLGLGVYFYYRFARPRLGAED
ncbi:membrane hypothetical protein [Desulfosarcina cetonica]|nr:membrane hypothetical protein [Desulfosarcina cetonica]